MRRFSRLLLWGSFLGALALVGGLLLLARQSLTRTPRQAYENATRAAFGPDRDPDAAFRSFDFALRGAMAEGDRDLAVDVLRARARLYTAMGSLNRARRDYEELLTRFRGDDLESQLALVRLLLRLGEGDEALERIDDVLRRHPGNASAQASRGLLLVRRAEEQLERADEVIGVMLPGPQRPRASAAVRRIAALSPSEPRRARLMQEVRGLFPAGSERQVQTVFEAARRAGQHMRQAREALRDSFLGQRSGDTLVAFLDLAEQAGKLDAAVAFALGSAHLPTAAARPEYVQATLDLLVAHGQPHLAADALGILLAENVGGPALYQRWCRLLYDQRRWSDLVGVANALYGAGSPQQRAMAMAYLGLAESELGRWSQALGVLRRYVVLDPPVEPFPGALPSCWAALARCWREDGRPQDELDALRRALRPTARTWSGPALDGELWLRMAELIEEGEPGMGGREELERVLTYAICCIPERMQEILPRWEDVGRRNIDAASIDLQLVLEEMLLDQDYSTPATASPYEVYRLAQMLKRRDLSTATLRACSRLLREYPGFLPALDLALETREELGQQREVAELLLARLDLLPGDESTLERLGELPPSALQPTDVLRLMDADPAGMARERLLAHLEGRGLEAVAAAGLLALPEESLRPQDQLRAARLLLDLGLPGQIEVALDRLPQHSPFGERALSLRLAAAAMQQDWEAFDLWLVELDGLEAVDGPGLEALLEPLLLDSPERAALLAGLLDQSARWRSGLLLLRLSQAYELLGDKVSAHVELSRADAFLPDGSPELGYLIESTAARDWGRLPLRVGELERSGMPRSALVDMLLDALGERTGRALEAIGAATQGRVQEPLWLLADTALAALKGRAARKTLESWWDEELQQATLDWVRGGEGDPRDVLALVLALQHPRWRAWAVARLLERGGDDPAEALWPAYVGARGLLQLGQVDRAEQLAVALVERWPRFRPGWQLLEVADRRVAERAAGGPGRVPREQPDSVSWVRWRERELVGLSQLDSSEEHWLAALEAERQGDVRLAQRELVRALERRPDDLRLRLTQIRLYAAERDWVPALQSMNRALELAPRSSDGVVAERALALRSAALRGAPRAQLDAPLTQMRELLAGRFPEDPLVAVELARMDVQASGSSPDIGLARALSRLDAFREHTRGAPLDRLREGATRAWFDFLLPFDPALACDLASRELRSTPGDPELWRMLSEGLVERGDAERAVEVLEMLQQALAFPGDARQLAWLRARIGVDRDAFEDAFVSVLAQEGLAEPDPDLLLARGTFLMNAGPYGWDAAIETLAPMWWKAQPQRAARTSQAGDAPATAPEAEQLQELAQAWIAAWLGLAFPEPALAEGSHPEAPDAQERTAQGEEAQVGALEAEQLQQLAEAWIAAWLGLARPGPAGEARPQRETLDPQTLREVAKAYALTLAWRGRPEDQRMALRLLDSVLPSMRWQPDAWVLEGLREVLAGRLSQAQGAP